MAFGHNPAPHPSACARWAPATCTSAPNKIVQPAAPPVQPAPPAQPAPPVQQAPPAQQAPLVGTGKVPHQQVIAAAAQQQGLQLAQQNAPHVLVQPLHAPQMPPRPSRPVPQMPPSAPAEPASLGGPPTSGAVVTPANAPPTQQPRQVQPNAPRVLHVGNVAPHSRDDPVEDELFVTHGEPPACAVLHWDASDPPADPTLDLLATPEACAKMPDAWKGNGWNWCSKRASWWFGPPGSWFSVARRSSTGTSYSYVEWHKREDMYL